MQMFLVMRRSVWETEDELEDSAALATRVEDDELADQVRWIRSYVLEEEDGTFGTVCIYEAIDEDALMEHAQRAEIPADEVIPIVNTMILRDDP